MKIGLVSTLSTTIRSEGGGSIESIVRMLARGLVDADHDVTVFAAGGSEVAGELVATLPGPYGHPDTPIDWQLSEWMNLCAAIQRSDGFDLIHSHPYLWGVPLQGMSATPFVHTLHVMPNNDFATVWRSHPDSIVTALSEFQWHAYPDLTPARVIHHGVDPADFPYVSEPEDYICYLGRFTAGKAPVSVFTSVRSRGTAVRLAGPPSPYFRSEIVPIVDDAAVFYEGAVSGRRRSEFLGHARALLYPIEKPEPFGLVLIEAMMCGTPVVAPRAGAAEEVVEDGVTGILVDDGSAYADAVEQAATLDRGKVRAAAESMYSADRMVHDYLRLYETIVES